MIRSPFIRIATIAIVFAAALGLQHGASAQEDSDSKGRGGAWARKNEVDKLTLQRFATTRELFAEEEWDAADAVLDRLRLRSMNSQEKKFYYAWRGYIASGRGDLTGARDNLVLASNETACTESDLETYLFQIAQFSMQLSDWTGAIEYFDRWFAIAKDPNSVSYYLLALSYWQMQDYDRALGPAKKAVELTPTPQEGWLQLLLALRLTRKEYVEAIPILDTLIREYPKKTYWIQLSTLHGALGNYEDSLVPLQLAYTQGLLTEDSEIRKLAELLLFLELPIRSVDVLRNAIEDKVAEPDAKYFELMSNGLIMAREYDQAVEPLQHAAELSEGGSLYLRLAEVHIQRERWEEANEALVKALEKGDLPNPGQCELLIGIAYYSRKLPDDAVEWFARAKEFPGTQLEASTWLNHIERERASLDIDA